MAGNWKMFSGRSRGSYPRRQKWIMLTVWAVCLAVVLGVIAVLVDLYRDKERLAEAGANATIYTGAVVTTEPTEAPVEETRAYAPDFVVYDAKGKQVTLEQFRGKPVVLTFWASWRNDCKEQMPILNGAYEDYKETVHFLFVNVPDGNRETRETADAFLKERGYEFPVYYDLDASAAVNYDVQNMPSTYFIDAQGRAMGYAGGKISRAIFERGLAQCYHE